MEVCGNLMNWYKKKDKSKKPKSDSDKDEKDFMSISGAEMDVVQRPNSTTDSNDGGRANSGLG